METYEGKSRGSESRFEPALLEPLPPGVLYAFFAGDDDEGNCAGLDEPAIRRACRVSGSTKQPSGTRSKIQRCTTYARTKATARFFSACYSPRLRDVQLHREVVCLLVSRAFPRETVGLRAEPGSSNGHHAAWVSAGARRRGPSRHRHRKTGLGEVMRTCCVVMVNARRLMWRN